MADRSPASEGAKTVKFGAGSAITLGLVLLALAFFVPFAWFVDAGILSSPMPQAAGQMSAAASASQGIGAGGVGQGGMPYLVIMEIVGPIIIGAALIYGIYRVHTRDRRMDPATEAATKELYRTAGRDDAAGKA